MRKTVTFRQWENIRIPGRNIALSVPFQVVDSSLIGKPEQESSAEHHRLVVSIADIKQHSWGFNDSVDSNSMKVLFEYGRRHIEGLLRSDKLPRQNTITMPMITSATHGDDKCPLNPAQIKEPVKAAFEVEVEKMKIGFI